MSRNKKGKNINKLRTKTTLTIDKDLLLNIKMQALKEGTTLNKLVIKALESQYRDKPKRIDFDEDDLIENHIDDITSEDLI